jgi:hypothetical protein
VWGVLGELFREHREGSNEMSPSIMVVATQHFKTKQEQDNKQCRLGRDSKTEFGGAIDVFL